MGSLKIGLVFCLLLTFATWTLASEETDMKAIKILETDNGEYDSRVLRTIDHHPGGPSLREVLMSAQTKHLPLLVFSVTGKTRSGKSFLLNLMHKYLQCEGNAGWESGMVPNIFEWKEGTDSTTRGLWISPTVFIRDNEQGVKVGIVLMDTQGLFDGEVTNGESVAMSGVSTILSHVQMFNMKEDISTNDLEHIMLHLVPDMPDLAMGNTTGTSLMFVIRDFIGGKKSGYGLLNGRIYIREEQNRGTEEYRSMWAEQRKVFAEIDCVLLPHPGLKVITDDFTRSPNLNELNGMFIDEIDKFFRQIFNPKNLVPHKGSLTGLKIHELLAKVNGKKADKNLSYYNMFLERINNANWEQSIFEFENKLNNSETLHNAHFLVDEIMSKSKFKGSTAQQKTFLLKKKLHDITNKQVKSFITDKYNHSLRSDSPKDTHEIVWPILLPLMDSMLLGADKQQARNSIIKDLTIIYYEKLSKDKEVEFKNACDKASSLEFVDNLLILNKEGERNLYIVREIEKNRDFESTSSNLSSLNTILLEQRLHFGDIVKKILLRNMFKVKQYFVDYYAGSLNETDIINQNVALWLEIKHRLDDLEFETASEQTLILHGIVKNIAKVYYEKLRKEQFDKIDIKWGLMDNKGFREEFDKYSNSAVLSELVSQLFPRYNGYENLAAIQIWENERKLLQVQLELAIYKGLKFRGYEKEAGGFWEKYGPQILKALENFIMKSVLMSVGLPTVPGLVNGNMT